MVAHVKKLLPRKLAASVLLLVITVSFISTVPSGFTHAGAAAANAVASADLAAGELNDLLPLVGGALASAGQDDWSAAAGHVADANKLWKQLAVKSTGLSADVESAFAHADKALKAASEEPKEAKDALSTLTKAINRYVKSTAAPAPDTAALNGKEAAVGLLPTAEQLLADIQAGEWSKANAAYKGINDSWPPIEQAIRTDNTTVYGKLETAMSMIRIALQAEPPRAEQAEKETLSFIAVIQDYKDGKLNAQNDESATSKLTIADLIVILDKASKDIASSHLEEANGQMNAFIATWPAVEGQVQIRGADIYSKIEIKMTDVSKYLLASPPAPDKAEAVVASMRELLAPLVTDKKYTAWDAGMILFREGLEAILVLAALLAYLKRTGNQAKSVWVWSGVWTGLGLSVVLAIVLTTVIAQASAGSAREAMEGITGLASVLLMLTVGNWLHNKSNMRAWNSYIDGKMGSAIARGSLWSLFIVSGLAILREGAETTIFYVGMSSSIAVSDMIIGIAVTFIVLLALGFAIIRFSAKLPIRPFFLTASALIYYLVIRFLGESIHSLQVAAWLPAHSSEHLPSIRFLGAYPTWETALPQLLFIVFIIGRVLWVQLGKTAGVQKPATE
ncbi:FTR1 family iron permease [Paenibacillus radicis (ex Gao et al. 2016)]|uniref:Fe 2+/Pb2+ permease n=1 Tax=Paenibacillus radicis (ex Gao et al. 2016) TaxID=1737354 RepID=A0A917HKK3_9BACL|nr:FTR1 family protein [Paenibacillus radicis (ex Gao et al. 2016)]GGG82541.1 Fe 2+/Pb2+ permease [Paenibacillus radicis (ex Gao et al. 2016)]